MRDTWQRSCSPTTGHSFQRQMFSLWGPASTRLRLAEHCPPMARNGMQYGKVTSNSVPLQPPGCFAICRCCSSSINDKVSPTYSCVHGIFEAAETHDASRSGTPSDVRRIAQRSAPKKRCRAATSCEGRLASEAIFVSSRTRSCSSNKLPSEAVPSSSLMMILRSEMR